MGKKNKISIGIGVGILILIILMIIGSNPEPELYSDEEVLEIVYDYVEYSDEWDKSFLQACDSKRLDSILWKELGRISRTLPEELDNLEEISNICKEFLQDSEKCKGIPQILERIHIITAGEARKIEIDKAYVGGVVAAYDKLENSTEMEFYILKKLKNDTSTVTGKINNAIEGISAKDTIRWLATDVVAGGWLESWEDSPGDTYYCVDTWRTFSQSGVVTLNVTWDGTTSLIDENGFEEEASVYKEVTKEKPEKIYEDYNEMAEQDDIIAQAIEEIKGIMAGNDATGETEEAAEPVAQPVANATNKSVPKATIEKEDIENYLGDWYVQEWGYPTMDSGCSVNIWKSSEGYYAQFFTAFSSGAVSGTDPILLSLSANGKSAYGYYYEDGWYNSGDICLTFDSGNMYFTSTAYGGSEYSTEMKDKLCAKM